MFLNIKINVDFSQNNHHHNDKVLYSSNLTVYICISLCNSFCKSISQARNMTLTFQFLVKFSKIVKGLVHSFFKILAKSSKFVKSFPFLKFWPNF